MNFEPSAGPSLIFQILPVTFNHFPGGFGWFWAGLFFLMLSIAALTSGASLLEMGVTFLIDQLNWSRQKTILVLFFVISALGVFSAVSIGGWEYIPWVKKGFDFCFSPDHVKGSFFDVLDYVTSNWCLPLAGMMTAIFAGWLWSARAAARELRKGSNIMDINLLLLLSGFGKEPFYRQMLNTGLTFTTLWAILTRYFAPVVILLVFLHSLGINLGF
jgi:NSS family neurotransmitter:Na+ symporter